MPYSIHSLFSKSPVNPQASIEASDFKNHDLHPTNYTYRAHRSRLSGHHLFRPNLYQLIVRKLPEICQKSTVKATHLGENDDGSCQLKLGISLWHKDFGKEFTVTVSPDRIRLLPIGSRSPIIDIQGTEESVLVEVMVREVSYNFMRPFLPFLDGFASNVRNNIVSFLEAEIREND